MRTLLAPMVILPLMLSVPAHAQGGPSADALINSLRPTGNLIQGGTRGIRAPSRPAATQDAVSAQKLQGKSNASQSGSAKGND